MSDKITANWKGNMVFESDNPRWDSIMMDASEEFGGTNSGMAPKAMMLSSLAGCSGLDVVSVLDKMKATVEGFYMTVEGELTEEHPKYYHTVTVEYHFTGKDLNESKIKKAVDLSVEKYCGVMEMFRKFANVKTSIHYHNK
ncbi:OsmC family protein [Lacinutrix sp. C3R15]|uniref:OsmC family protein n=1 Tax=Flavobacteriaceae TaxID=49546 RepID=UPI001C07F5A2|nr:MULTISPECIES: OsmC family protein [Flavobacteriaceae]MBU2937957.1 OsmC family protein [Lacinutrix sp. C3R15]MDO6621271.1 OsmC family protein [Oceanihabitans sp. 1_MG-2023]